MAASLLDLEVNPMPIPSAETKLPSAREVLLPVTRLVSTLRLTIRNGQLVALPSLIIGPGS
jgi:hypothetical protein